MGDLKEMSKKLESEVRISGHMAVEYNLVIIDSSIIIIIGG